jgi:hypothetical protein
LNRKKVAADAERLRDRNRKRRKRAETKAVFISACKDKRRRKRLEANDEAWLLWYFGPESGTNNPFTYEFTEQQKEMIAAIRKAILVGGDQSLAASRGEGKTTYFERQLLKYTLTGIIKLSVLFGATGGAADDSLESMRVEIETNGRLRADYPEACEPVIALENTPSRAHYQLVTGKRHDNGKPYEETPSKFRWCGKQIEFPNVPGAPCAGGIIVTRGLDSAVRGVKKKGRRVDVAGIDDPDTEETALSAMQSKKLEDRIDRAIAGLGSQTRRVARVMLTTLQNKTCASFRFTDPTAKPSWHGRRFRFLIKKPERMDLWEQYIQLRKEDWRNETAGAKSTTAHDFYVAHRKAMDAGAVVANPNRCASGELSALQFYFNEVARIGPEAVAAEYDNDPIEELSSSELLSVDQICAKTNGYLRGLVPSDAAYLSAFIDVQGKLLYWAVCAWRPDFTGYLVDYGAWPGQRRPYFTLADASPTIGDLCGGGFEASIYAALEKLVGTIVGKEWPVDGGGVKNVDRCLIDANWGESTPTVYSFCRQSPHAAVLLPTHGRGVKASTAPIMLWPKQDGEQLGLNWRIRRTTQKHAPIRHGVYDTNFWKSLAHARLFVPMADAGCLSLFKAEPSLHRMLADQLHAEYPVPVESQGRRVSEWQQRPNHPDNHFLDCLTGCCVGGSILGAALPSDRPDQPRPKMRLSELYKRKHGGKR